MNEPVSEHIHLATLENKLRWRRQELTSELDKVEQRAAELRAALHEHEYVSGAVDGTPRRPPDADECTEGE